MKTTTFDDLGIELSGIGGSNNAEECYREFLSCCRLHLLKTRNLLNQHSDKLKPFFQTEKLRDHLDHAIGHWDNDLTREAALERLSAAEDEHLQPHLQPVGDLLNGNDNELFGLLISEASGLGRRHKKRKRNGFFTTLKKSLHHAKEAIRHGAQRVKAFAKKAGRFIAKNNPFTLSMRLGFLALLKSNFSRLAEHSYWGSFSQDYALAHGVSSEYWKRSYNAYTKLQNFFTHKLRGEGSALHKAIITGRGAAISKKLASRGKLQGLGAIDPKALEALLSILKPIIESIAGSFGKNEMHPAQVEEAESSYESHVASDLPNYSEPNNSENNDVVAGLL